MALHRELIKRRPSQYPRRWLAQRLGVNTRTIAAYNSLIPIHSKEMHIETPITWKTIERLPFDEPLQGAVLVTLRGKRYPALRMIASRLLAMGQGITLKQQTVNYYWYGEEEPLIEVLADTPFLDWLPLREAALDPLSPSGELLCVTLGLLAPCLLGYCVIRHVGRRALFALGVVAVGVTLTALSAALSWGPVHAWEWMGLPTRVGVWGALALAVMLLALPRRACAAVLLVALVWHLALLNQAPTSAYFAQTLQIWEQGRFIRFYGLGQWLGWLWPYATLIYVVFRVSRKEGAS